MASNGNGDCWFLIQERLLNGSCVFHNPIPRVWPSATILPCKSAALSFSSSLQLQICAGWEAALFGGIPYRNSRPSLAVLLYYYGNWLMYKIVARFNEIVTKLLLEGALDTFSMIQELHKRSFFIKNSLGLLVKPDGLFTQSAWTAPFTLDLGL